MRIRSLIIVVYDLLAIMTSWLIAGFIMANLRSHDLDIKFFLQTLPVAFLTQGLSFQLFFLHLDLWRFISISHFVRIFLAVLIGTLFLGLGVYELPLNKDIPAGLLILDAIILVLMLGFARIVYRIWRNQLWPLSRVGAEDKIILIGAGQAAASLLHEWPKTVNGRVVALLDDNLTKHGRTLSGIKVIGSVDEIDRWAKFLDAKRALIAMPSATMKQRKRAAELAQAAGLEVLSVPSLEDILSGNILLSSVRKVELEDLLRRGPVQLDSSRLAELIGGAVVLVTGAGGSIGSELCRQILLFKPSALICFDISELALYTSEQEFSKAFPTTKISYLVGDIKNEMRLDQVMISYGPSLVFHAAAYKHVPMMEKENAWEAVQNNILGTIRLALAATRHNVKKFVLVSTDKAVNPVNVMGATKRLAELCCKVIQGANTTQFVTVRFGNVMGSSGSVIPKFRDQIAGGGPVTVTHPDVVRYFMLIPEAAQLILQAALMGNGGEIYVLDMGEPVRILDLARDLINFSGFSEDVIKIEFTGLRPGEKLYEELLADDEVTLPTPHPALRISNSNQDREKVNLDMLQQWLEGPSQSEDDVKKILKYWVQEYNPQSLEKCN